MADPAAAEPTVLISAARLAELEALEAKANAEKTERIEYLRKKDKAAPEHVRARVKRYQDKDRTAYNARRRELYRQKKAGAGGD